MSTTPAPVAGAPVAPPSVPAAPAPKSKVDNVPKDIRDRVLSGRPFGPKADVPAIPNATPAAAPVAPAAAPPVPVVPAAAPVAPDAPPVPRVKKVKAGPPLPAAPAAPAAQPDGRSVEQIVRDVLPEITKQNAPPAPAVDPEIQREIDLARFAEQKNGDRYAGMANKVQTFYTANNELLASKAKELGGEKSPEFKDWIDSEEYRGWVAQNRPSYARGDKARFTEDMIADRARSEARREMAPELKALERKTAELEMAPTISARKQAALGIIIHDPSEVKDPALVGFSKDPIKFGESYPEEARLIASEAGEAVELVEEIYRIDKDLVDFNPKAPTPKQAKIREFSVNLNTELRAKHPNGFEAPDGKILIDADTYYKLGLQKDARYRTFTADELAGALAFQRNVDVRSKLKQRREGVAKSIYAQLPEQPAPAQHGQPPAEPEQPASPTAPSAAAPGGKGTPPSDPYKNARRKALTGK